MQKVEFDLWRNGPTGKWFFDQVLEENIKELAMSLANGSCQDNDPGKVAMNYMDQVGVIAGIQFVRNIDPFGDENEVEGDRPTPVGADGY